MIDLNQYLPKRCGYNMYENGYPCQDWNLVAFATLLSFLFLTSPIWIEFLIKIRNAVQNRRII